ncbi:MAG: MBL fold metallo-hydrolase [bacterium]
MRQTEWKKWAASFLGIATILALVLIVWFFLFYTRGPEKQITRDVGVENIAAPTGILKIAFLDVGQGDAILVIGPDGTTVLFDGGPDRTLLARLGEVLPFWQHSIDMIVITNPDKDHIAGFVPLLQTMNVGAVLEPGTSSVSATYHTLKDDIVLAQKENGTKTLIARKGTRFPIGDGAEIDILFPDRDVSGWKTNDGSIIARVVYASTSVLLTGDATKKTESLLGALDPVDILKVGHHGSRTSTGESFVSQLTPKWAVISAGFQNKYGHPHQETLNTLKKFDVTPLITSEKGTIIFTSDGRTFSEPTFIRTNIPISKNR